MLHESELKVNFRSLTHIFLGYLTKLLTEWNWYTTWVSYHQLKSAQITLSIILAPVSDMVTVTLECLADPWCHALLRKDIILVCIVLFFSASITFCTDFVREWRLRDEPKKRVYSVAIFFMPEVKLLVRNQSICRSMFVVVLLTNQKKVTHIGVPHLPPRLIGTPVCRLSSDAELCLTETVHSASLKTSVVQVCTCICFLL